MDIIKISLLILITVFLVNSLPAYNREISIITTISCCIVVLLYILKNVVFAIEYIKNIAETTGFNDIEVVLKAVGIGFITQFVADTAIDCNNKSLSNQVIFAGRVAVLIIAMPLFLEVIEIIGQLT